MSLMKSHMSVLLCIVVALLFQRSNGGIVQDNSGRIYEGEQRRVYDPEKRNQDLIAKGLGSVEFPPDSWLGYALDMRKGAGVNSLDWDNVSTSCSSLC